MQSFDRLPRICYIGFRIEPSVAGAAVLYKLLSDYPKDRLFSFEFESRTGLPSIAVHKTTIPSFAGSPRIHTAYDLSFAFARKWWAKWFRRRLGNFDPEAIVSILHGWQCMAAGELARQLQIPLHLILHDDWRVTLPTPKFLFQWASEQWTELCQSSASQLCVSPYLAEEVRKLTGKSAEVLYPGLPRGLGSAIEPTRARGTKANGLIFVFCGVMHAGYESLIELLAKVLAHRGHKLIVHSPGAADFIERRALPATIDGGLLSPDNVAMTLQQEADVCFLPMSFREQDVRNTRVSFPSKLVEYCAAGKPVLVYAPSYSSVVRWARERIPFSVIVQSEQENELDAAVSQLESVELRKQLGEAARQIADQLFSHEATYGRFIEVISHPLVKPGSPCASAVL